MCLGLTPHVTCPHSEEQAGWVGRESFPGDKVPGSQSCGIL